MKRQLLSVIVTLAVFGSGAVSADPKEFKDVDSDADGFLTKAEFANAGADSDFEEFDANEDGKVSKEEYQEKLEECE
jgi:Ca2+-binding EF-hand superfamily protein